MGKWLKEKFYWSGSYIILKESYGITAICAFIALRHMPVETTGEKLMTACTYLGLAQLVLVPVWTVWILLKYKDKLGEESYKKKFHAWSDGLNENMGSKVIIWPVLFFVRRALLAATVLYVDHLFAQIFLLTAQGVV